MSLINDALKQANKATKEQPREAATSANMEPVQPGQNEGGTKFAFILAALLLPLLGGAGWFLGQWWQYQKNAALPVNGVPLHTNSSKRHPAESILPGAPDPADLDPLLPHPIAPPVEIVEAPPPVPKPANIAIKPVETTPEVSNPPPVVVVKAPPRRATSKPKTAPEPVVETVLIPKVTTPPPPKKTNDVVLEPFPDMTVYSIFYSKRPSAVISIGDQSLKPLHHDVRVGDRAEGVRIVTIQSNKIVVEWKGRTNVIY